MPISRDEDHVQILCVFTFAFVVHFRDYTLWPVPMHSYLLKSLILLGILVGLLGWRIGPRPIPTHDSIT
jgi:hypothetical protein